MKQDVRYELLTIAILIIPIDLLGKVINRQHSKASLLRNSQVKLTRHLER